MCSGVANKRAWHLHYPSNHPLLYNPSHRPPNYHPFLLLILNNVHLFNYKLSIQRLLGGHQPSQHQKSCHHTLDHQLSSIVTYKPFDTPMAKNFHLFYQFTNNDSSIFNLLCKLSKNNIIISDHTKKIKLIIFQRYNNLF